MCVHIHVCLSIEIALQGFTSLERVIFRENIWTVFIELVRVCVALAWQTFIVKTQIVYISGFPGHEV